MLQAGRPWLRFRIRSSHFSIDLNIPEAPTTLGSTQPLTETNTRNLPGGKLRLAHKISNIIDICELIVYKMWEPRRLTALRASATCYRDSFTFFACSFYDVQYKNEYNNSLINSSIWHILAVARTVNF
jgi:hypothetical protein